MRSAKRRYAMIWICWFLLTLSVGSLGILPLAGAASVEDIIENFETSLHGTRIGKDTYYSNPISSYDPIPMGGFYHLTGVPDDDLACKNCHGQTYADDTPIGPDYQPGCRDCHAVQGPDGR